VLEKGVAWQHGNVTGIQDGVGGTGINSVGKRRDLATGECNRNVERNRRYRDN